MRSLSRAVIVVPGLTGSRLERNGEVIWPGRTLDAFVTRYDRLDDLMADDVVATDVLRRAGPFGVYAPLLEDLESWGFSETGGTLVPFGYDWRRDGRVTATALADTVDRLAESLGSDADISLVAHSMGGLVSRSYLECGAFDARPGFRAVRRLLCFGTPQRGAPLALLALLGLERVAFLQKDQAALLGRDPRFPAAYQLLPPTSEPFVWRGNDGREAFLPVETHEEELGLCTAGLEAARLFRETLSLSRRPPHVRYFLFVGTTQRTTTHVRLTPSRVERVDTASAGDGTVPSWSATLQGTQHLTVGGAHRKLFCPDETRQVLAALLGVPPRRAPASRSLVELAIRDGVVDPDGPLHLTVSLAPGIRLNGRLRIEALAEQGTEALLSIAPDPAFVPVAEMTLDHAGPPPRSLALLLRAPRERGAYRISFHPEDGSGPSATDDFFVQGS